MPLNYSVGGGGGGDFKRLSAGTHLGVCNVIADVGYQPGSQMYPDPKRKVVLRWEVPSERVEYEIDGKKHEGPMCISATFTASMSGKSNLRKFLEGWRGKKFTDEEAAAFDVSSVLGKACLLTIAETTKGDETYSNVAGASPLMKGMVAPQAENPLLYYAEDDRGAFDKLPKRIREKIESQLPPPGAKAKPAPVAEIADDDIPF